MHRVHCNAVGCKGGGVIPVGGPLPERGPLHVQGYYKPRARSSSA